MAPTAAVRVKGHSLFVPRPLPKICRLLQLFFQEGAATLALALREKKKKCRHDNKLELELFLALLPPLLLPRVAAHQSVRACLSALIKMAATAMDYEPANGDRFDGGFPRRRIARHAPEPSAGQG